MNVSKVFYIIIGIILAGLLVFHINHQTKIRNAYTHYNQGTAYLNKGLYDKAVVDYTKAIELNPRYSDAYHRRGIAYTRKYLNDKAIEDYTTAIKLNPKLAEAYKNRGDAYYEKILYDKAIEDYTKVIELGGLSFNFIAHEKRARAYQKKGMIKEAESDFKKVTEMETKANLYFNQGNAYLYKKLYDEAIESYNKAIELNPQNTDFYIYRARAYLSRGKSLEPEGLKIVYYQKEAQNKVIESYNKAIDDYSKVIELNPRYAEAYWGRGHAYKAKGMNTEAEEDFKKAKELGFKFYVNYQKE